MTNAGEFRELSQLLGQLVDNDLTDAARVRLLELLRGNPAARGYYLDYMDIHARLAWKHELRDSEGAGYVDAAAEVQLSEEADADESLMASDASVTALLPEIAANSGVFHASSFANPLPFGSLLLSYVMAAIVLGAGLAVVMMCEVSRSQAQQVEKITCRTTTTESTATKQPGIVCEFVNSARRLVTACGFAKAVRGGNWLGLTRNLISERLLDARDKPPAEVVFAYWKTCFVSCFEVCVINQNEYFCVNGLHVGSLEKKN